MEYIIKEIDTSYINNSVNRIYNNKVDPDTNLSYFHYLNGYIPLI